MLSELTGRVEGVTVEYVGEEWWEGGWMGVWDICNLEFPFSFSSGFSVEEYKASKLSSIVDTTSLSRDICNKKGNREESLSHHAVIQTSSRTSNSEVHSYFICTVSRATPS